MQKKKTVHPVSALLSVFIAGLTVASFLGLFGRLHWFMDLFSHFRVQLMQLCLVLLAITLWKRMHRRTIVLILLFCVNYTFILPLYFGRPDPPSKKPIRAMLMNLYAGNGNTRQVLERIEQVAPDVLLLEEVTRRWESELQPLQADYPYRIAMPRPDNFGILLLSKYPLERGEILFLGPAQVPTISSEVHTPTGVFHFIGTHPLPPVGPVYALHRNIQLQELAKYVRNRDFPTLLMGDLNTTPWSPHFAALIGKSGLKNSMKGFGYQPTWPADHPFLRIPLDHALHSPEIIIHNRMIGGEVGSDHLPLILDFSIR